MGGTSHLKRVVLLALLPALALSALTLGACARKKVQDPAAAMESLSKMMNDPISIRLIGENREYVRYEITG
jgi:hypothetical protein